MKNDNANMGAPIVAMFIVFCILIAGVGIGGAVISVAVSDERTITIQEKLGAHGDSGQYLVIDTNDNVYTVEDNYLLLSFDASNRYAKLKEGKTYDVKTRGIRLPLLSWYPNIMESEEI